MTRFLILLAWLLAVALPPVARASLIAVNFSTGSTTNLSSLSSAGVVAQANWKNWLSLTPNGSALNDDAGNATTATLTINNTVTFNTFAANSSSNDEKLNNGFVRASSLTSWSFTISHIPFATYDLIVYDLDMVNAVKSVTAGGTTYWTKSSSPTAAGYVDNNGATSYTYTQGSSTNSATPTVGADYVRFQTLTLSDLTVTVHSPSFPMTRISGFQIVEVASPAPEPGTFGLLGLALGALVAVRRRAGSLSR